MTITSKSGMGVVCVCVWGGGGGRVKVEKCSTMGKFFLFKKLSHMFQKGGKREKGKNIRR